MKGKLILTPIDKPREGMQVVLGSSIEIINKIGTEKFEDEGHIYLKGYDPEDWSSLDELDEIRVEYENWERSADSFDLDLYSVTRTMPLAQQDWEWAIEHIGEEVEFIVYEPFPPQAKIQLVENSRYPGVKDEDIVPSHPRMIREDRSTVQDPTQYALKLAAKEVPSYQKPEEAPKTYTEEEVEDLILAFGNYLLDAVRVNSGINTLKWWKEHKKK